MSRAPRTSLFLLSTAIAAFAGMSSPAFALPDDRVVTFQVHENPADPASPTRLTFTLEITAAASDGNAIGWQIKTVDVAEHAADGAVARAWSDAIDPTTDPAQLWWITHADPENPSPKEFFDVPQLHGISTPRLNTDTPLRYALTSTGSVDSSTGEKSALATFSIAADSNPELPIIEGDEEPVESGGTVDPH